MSDLAADVDLLRHGVGGIWLARDVVQISGPAAISFLQGQVSQDVATLAIGQSAWSWVLQPQGKVESLVRVARVAEDAMTLDTDAGWGEALMARLSRFKLRVKADIIALDWRCFGLRGPGAAACVAAAGDGGGVFALDAGWPGLPGVDLLGADPVPPAGVVIVDPEAFEVARICAGVPRMGTELSEKTIPAETGLIDRTVSFTKGCYTGQELVARIDSRGGRVPRNLRGVVLAARAPVGATIVVNGKAVGTLTSVAGVADRAGEADQAGVAGVADKAGVAGVAGGRSGGAVALAYIGRDVVPPVAAEATWDEGTTGALITTVPFEPAEAGPLRP